MNGFININKAEGMGSTYAVSKVKRKLNARCGHMGTLDPLASGVLPVGINKSTRLFDFLLDKQKTYIAEFEFGYLTDTLDCMGKVVESGGLIPTKDEIMREIGAFVGEIDQIPPRFSAKMVAGRRGYDLARKGIDFDLPPKRVTIEGIELEEQLTESKFRFRIDCKGGTYIRSIARDLGDRLGTFGTMTALKRTRSGIFTLENSVTVEELLDSDNPQQFIIPTDEAVSFEKLRLSALQAERLLNGLYDSYEVVDGLYRVYNQDEFWGVGIIENGLLKMKAYCREC